MFNWILKHRQTIFLVGLLFFFFIPEIIEMIFHVRVRFPLRIIILTVSSIPLIHQQKKSKVMTGLVIFFVIGLCSVWAIFEQTKELAYSSIALLFLYFSFISHYLFLDVFTSRRVTLPIIIGSFTGYFLIGVLFFLLFTVFDLAFPGTVNIDNKSIEGLERTFYFSFITLTTIGYGDYLPTSTLGQKLALLEALIGQFYIAAVIASIVGKFITQDSAKQQAAEKRREKQK